MVVIQAVEVKLAQGEQDEVRTELGRHTPWSLEENELQTDKHCRPYLTQGRQCHAHPGEVMPPPPRVFLSSQELKAPGAQEPHDDDTIFVRQPERFPKVHPRSG